MSTSRSLGSPLQAYFEDYLRCQNGLGSNTLQSYRAALLLFLPFIAAVHLLEARVEVNVIRAWLGHVSLETTNRYAEINLRIKAEALEACAPPVNVSAEFPRKPIWRDDQELFNWLQSL